jgi:succinyl-CoA synthetase beta subunit
MNIHEYQAKDLFKQAGIPIPQSELCTQPDQAGTIIDRLGLPCVIKAQVHAGGRGKAGGVKLARTRQEALDAVGKILSMRMVNRQTGPEGKVVGKILIEQGVDIQSAYYLAVLIDRASRMPLFIAGEGGMEIEEIAAQDPDRIARVSVHPVTGLMDTHIRRIAEHLHIPQTVLPQLKKIMTAMHRLLWEKDGALIEINPLILTEDQHLIALDAKFNFDDSALPLHPEIAQLRDLAEESPLEVEASRHHLNYIKLSGTIGCMVNGAGLAMATMDIIKHYGAEPANFLDVGGGTSEERVTEAFRILLGDPDVKAVFVNIFGGIVRTDLVAAGIIQALRTLKAEIPIVIRLVGTNQEEGRRLIEQSGLDFIAENDLAKAAQKVVALSKGV